MKNIKILFVAVCMGAVFSCEDFLNRPSKTDFSLPEFYQTDAQCLQAVNTLYNLPWQDFLEGWMFVGDAQSGNLFEEGNVFWMLSPTETERAVGWMWQSLWSVNARANTVIENIDIFAGTQTTEVGRNTAKGEALVWKAMAYFYLVRIYGAVPIMHNNSEMVTTGEYNTVYRAKIENVYDYIIMTLEQAIKWLPEKNEKGRIDKFCAYGLLAKVYLTKSGYGRSGDRNTTDLNQAREYARKVVRESGRILMPEYSDIFRGVNDKADESLIAWRWQATPGDNPWTCANILQPIVAPTGFTEGNSWGGWKGPSIDLQEAFGEKFNGTSPSGALSSVRNNLDKRRKATMMMYGDVYEYFWIDRPVKKDADGNDVSFDKGFDFTKFYERVAGYYHSSTGANCVKHIVGNDADHRAAYSMPLGGKERYRTSLATHILRLGDVYLVYAEAILGNAASTTDAEALWAFNEIRKRAGVPERNSITFDDIFKERRLELALEGDFWYDLVRWHYYKPNEALAFLNGQNRKNYEGLDGYYKDKGWNSWGVEGGYPKVNEQDGKLSPRINEMQPDGKPFTHGKFTMPFYSNDLQMNPNLVKDPIDYDISQYRY